MEADAHGDTTRGATVEKHPANIHHDRQSQDAHDAAVRCPKVDNGPAYSHDRMQAYEAENPAACDKGKASELPNATPPCNRPTPPYICMHWPCPSAPET